MPRFLENTSSTLTLPLLILLSGCGIDVPTHRPKVNLEHIDIIASPITTEGASQLTLAGGNNQPFEATGRYSDDSSRALTDLHLDWISSDQDIGYFESPGVLIGGDTPGEVTVYATKDGIVSNHVTITITAAVITGITLLPASIDIASGQTQQFIAHATYSDTTSTDITGSITWDIEDPETAIVTETGLLTGGVSGTTTLTATKDGVISNIATVNVTDTPLQ
nr:Ig-like domain-containing protein [Vibrio sp. D420a]